MKKVYVFQCGENWKSKVMIEAKTILEARDEIRRDFPSARFVEIRINGRKCKKAESAKGRFLENSEG